MSDNLKQRAVSGAIWYGGSRFAMQGISWVITIAVARALSPSDYGLFGIALLYIGCIEFLNDMGLGSAIVQRQNLDEEELHSLFWLTNIVGLAFYGLALLVAPFVAKYFHQPQLTHLIWFIGLNHIITSLQQIPWSILTRTMDFKRRSIAEVIANLLSGLITVILAYKGWGVWALACGFLSRSTLTMLQSYSQTNWRPKLKLHWPHVSQVLRFSTTLTGATVAYYVHSNAASLIIGRLLGGQSLGYYSLASRFTIDLSGRLTSIMNQVAFPVYSQLQNESQRLKKYYLISTEIICTLVFPAMIGLFLVADDAIPLLLGSTWTPIILPFKFLTGAAVATTINSMVTPVLIAKGRTDLGLHFNLLCLAVLPLSFYIGAGFGLIGVCLVWVIVYPILVAFWCSCSKRIVGYAWSEFFKALAPSTASSIGMAGVVFGIMKCIPSDNHLIRTITIIMIGLSTYIVFLLMLGRESLHKMQILLKSYRESQP